MLYEVITIEGEKPLLQGNENEYRDNMSDLNYRIIISPESKDVDLSLLAKKLVTRLETETGFKFYWLSAEHHNTDSPHVHIAINGLDRNGKKVRITSYNVCYTKLLRAVTDLLLDGFTDISMKIENEELTIDPETRLPFKEIFS